MLRRRREIRLWWCLRRTFESSSKTSKLLGFRRRVDPDCKPDRCETNYASFKVFSEHLARKKNLIRSWGWVLRRGTEHFSAEFSQFCDRKMSDVVSMLCWNRVWPKPLYRGLLVRRRWFGWFNY
ncbi:hypothetical protein Bca4012_092932 [Brassica carinata]